jgi:hypothetical protein
MEQNMMTHYDRTRVTFHRGNAFTPEGIEAQPFATLTIDDLVERELIDAICALVRDHVNKAHADFCNIRISTEDWDC